MNDLDKLETYVSAYRAQLAQTEERLVQATRDALVATEAAARADARASELIEEVAALKRRGFDHNLKPALTAMVDALSAVVDLV